MTAVKLLPRDGQDFGAVTARMAYSLQLMLNNLKAPQLDLGPCDRLACNSMCVTNGVFFKVTWKLSGADDQKALKAKRALIRHTRHKQLHTHFNNPIYKSFVVANFGC